MEQRKTLDQAWSYNLCQEIKQLNILEKNGGKKSLVLDKTKYRQNNTLIKLFLCVKNFSTLPEKSATYR